MSNRQDLSTKLAKARQQFQKAQAQVADLESQLDENQPNHFTVLTSEDRYHRVFDSLLEGAEIIGFDWRYLYVNDASASHGRQTKEVLLRSTVIELYPGIENTAMFAVFRTCMEERTAQHFETEFVFPDGTASWFDLSVQPIPEGIFILSIDITRYKQAENALKRYTQRMEILHEIDFKIIEASSIQSLLEVIVKHLRQLIPCPRVAAALLDQNTGESVLFAIDLNSPSAIGEGVRTSLPADWFEGFGADHTRIIDDFRLLPDPLPAYQQLIKEGIVTSLQVLLMDREHPIGVLGLSADVAGFFTPEHQEIAAEVGNQLAIAVKQLQLSEQIKRHAAELEQKVADRTADVTAAKERVEAILNNSTDGILLVHPDLTIRQTNASFNHLFACEPDDYFDQSLIALIYPEDTDRVTKLFQKVAVEQQENSIEIRAVRKDGTIFDAELSIGHVKDDGLVCTLRDITERKVQERQLRYQASLQENVTDAVIVADMEYRIQSWNKAAERIYGWSAEEIINKATLTILHNEFSSPGERERSTQQLYEQGWWQGEVSQHHKDGSIRHVLGSVTLVKDKNGLPFGVVSVNHDVTERKAQERQLRYLASLQESVVDAVIVTDTTFHIQTWNTGAERIYGWKADEIIGKAAPDVLQIRHLPSQEQGSSRQRFDEQGFLQQETIQRRKDGSDITILGSATLLKDEKGVAIGVISVNRDITERKRTEAALSARLAEEREFQGYLKALHEITIELMEIDQLDEFYKYAVELGCTRLGFERLSLFLFDAEQGVAIGTYGTDNQGNLVDERELQFVPAPDGIMGRAIGGAERFYIDENVQLSGSDLQVLGSGWNAAAALWNGTQSAGWLVADNLLYHKPVSKPLLDILSLYALTVGTLLAQKQVQIAQRESEARYRLLADYITDVVVRANATGEYVYISPSCRAMWGYEPEELLGQNIANYVHPDDLSDIIESFTGAAAQKFSNFSLVVRFRHKQGHYIWMETIGRAIRSEKTGEVEGVITSSRDISDRKRAEDALRTSEQHFRLLVNGVSDYGIYLLDKAGNIVSWNPGAERIQGYTEEEIISQHFSRFYVPKDVARGEPERVLRIAEREGRFIGEGWRVRKDGSRLWAEVVITALYDENNRLIGFSEVTRDLTERKRTEDAAQEQHDFLQLVIDSVPDMILVKDQAGHFQWVNEFAAQIYGITTTEMIGKTDANVNPNLAQTTSFVKADQETLASGKTTFIPEEIVQNRYYQTSKIPLQNRNGVYDRLLVVASDITERKQAEEILRQSLAKEKELGELKSRFVSMASHEFRTPLATILALTETLSAYRHRLPDDQIEKKLGKITEQINHLKSIMDDVLLLARMQSRRVEFNPAKVDLDALCRSVLDEFQSRPDVKHRLDYFCSEGIQEVNIDRKLMRQIISNLMSNAIKYSPPDKTIRVKLEAIQSAVILKVSDEGIGIPEADMKYLFEPFHRAANAEAIPGTGLGLVITKESVELHGGTISVESQVDVGTTFTVCIPISTAGVSDDGAHTGR